MIKISDLLFDVKTKRKKEKVKKFKFKIYVSYSLNSVLYFISLAITVFPKMPVLKPMLVKESEIIKEKNITPRKRKIILKRLYSFKMVVLINNMIKTESTQEASPKITNKIALRFAP